MKRYIKKPEFTERIQKNGYIVRVYDGEGDNAPILKEYTVSPEQIAEENRIRERNLKELLERHSTAN
jgi:DNA-binding PadR family transcriptional regulator